MILDALIALSIVIGSSFILVGAIGLTTLGDIYSRLHGPTKATTLGMGGLLLASILYFSTREPGVSLDEILVIVFLFLTAPVSAHMLARAALHLRVESITRPIEDRYRDVFPGAVRTGSAVEPPAGAPAQESEEPRGDG